MTVRSTVRATARPTVRGSANGRASGSGSSTPPALLSATVATDGETWTLQFSKAVIQGSGWDVADLTATGSVAGALTFTYVSGDETSAWVLTASEALEFEETATLDWAGTADGIEDGDGQDLEAIEGFAAVNTVEEPYPLAGLSPALAYSSIRQLSATHSAAIRVRESGGGALADIGFADRALDTAALASHVGSNSGYVRRLYDAVAAVNLFQLTDGSQPRIVNAGTIEADGMPRFDGSDDELECDDTGALGDSEISWEVPGGFINTGLAYAADTGNLLVGQYDDVGSDNAIVELTTAGAYVGEVAATGQVQGIAYDTSDDTVWYVDTTNEVIRHINRDGTDAGGSISGLAYIPNGIAYEPASDSLWVIPQTASGTQAFRRYLCSDGSLAQTLTFTGLNASTQLDMIHYVPDADCLLACDDFSDTLYVFRCGGSGGAEWVKTAMAMGTSPEGMVLLDGWLYWCADRLFHDSVANGNRVHRRFAGFPTGSFTLSVLIDPLTVSATGAAFVRGVPLSDPPPIGWGLYIPSGGTTARFFVRDHFATQISKTETIGSGARVVTVVVDRSADLLHIYDNGTEVGSGTSISTVVGLVDLPCLMSMGSSHELSSSVPVARPLQAQMGEVVLASGAWSSGQVSAYSTALLAAIA